MNWLHRLLCAWGLSSFCQPLAHQQHERHAIHQRQDRARQVIDRWDRYQQRALRDEEAREMEARLAALDLAQRIDRTRREQQRRNQASPLRQARREP